MNHDCLVEVANHFRKHLKGRAIKARVKMNRNGNGSIIISAPAYGIDFNGDAQAFMVELATALHMSGPAGLPPSARPYGAEFWLTDARIAEWRQLCARFPNGPACRPAY
jgi:hypothetical protein